MQMKKVVSRKGRGFLGKPMVVMVVCLLAGGCGGQGREGEVGGMREVEIGGRRFRLELSVDEESRVKGLSDREGIAEDGGMLFVFPQPRVLVFVMRRCLVPIDVVFVGPNGRVVSTHAMEVEPYETAEGLLRRYESEWPAQFAIELRGGTVSEIGLKAGDRVELPLGELKRLAY
jgi:uncharacterized membrane protein (UPF0127 family)